MSNLRKEILLYLNLIQGSVDCSRIRLFYDVRIPTRTLKPGQMGRHFPFREKLGIFEQNRKVRENHTKYWKIRRNVISYF